MRAIEPWMAHQRVLRDGREVLMRPIRPADKQGLREGIQRLSASVLAENSAIIELIFKFGDAHVTARHDAVVELLMDLPPEGLSETLRHTVRAAARGELRLSGAE